MGAIYLYGSAVRGGLQKDSDVDILAIVDEDISAMTKKELTEKLLIISGRINNKESKRCLELTIVKLSDITPWKYPARRLYQYGEWLRADFEEGLIPAACIDPDLALILSQVRQHSVTLVGSGEAASLISPIPQADINAAMADLLDDLLNGLYEDERNTLLTLARMWATVETGEFFSKDAAAIFVMPFINTQHSHLLEIAAKGYRGECVDNWDNLKNELHELTAFMKQKIECMLQKKS